MLCIKNLSHKRKMGACALLVLVILNMCMIFFFSSEGFDATSDRSEQIADAVINAGDKRPTNSNPMTDQEKEQAAEKLSFPIRKMAHFLEFMSLGLLSCALLLTVKLKPWWLTASVAAVFSLLYAISDEVHQIFVDGRDGSFRDVMIDFSGVLCGVALAFLVTQLVLYVRGRRKERHAVQSV